MKGRWVEYLLMGTIVVMLAACSSKLTDRRQQYKDGKSTWPFSLVNQPDVVDVPTNAGDFTEQINHIRNPSPRLCGNRSNVYNTVQEWLRASDDIHNMRQFDIDAWWMKGVDNYGNVQFTGYYMPVVQTCHTRQGEFQCPIYRMPPKRGRLSSRAETYAGTLSDKYILAYSNSLMDSFIMDVQGSGYIDFGDGSPLNFFSYTGKDGHAYRNTGGVLIDRSKVKKGDMSMRAIHHWGETHNEAEVREPLEQDPFFVFFKPQSFAPVKGAGAVSPVGRTSVASNHSITPPGTTLLAEVPLLGNNGKFNGQYELCLMVALGVGGAIKGQHFDIYQGIGSEVGHRAGWYNRYGCVWVLKTAPGVDSVFSG